MLTFNCLGVYCGCGLVVLIDLFCVLVIVRLFWVTYRFGFVLVVCLVILVTGFGFGCVMITRLR